MILYADNDHSHHGHVISLLRHRWRRQILNRQASALSVGREKKLRPMVFLSGYKDIYIVIPLRKLSWDKNAKEVTRL